MDKSKFALPRWVLGRSPKGAEGMHRPTLTVTTVISHGYGVCIFVADESLATGSNWNLECIMRAMDLSWHQAVWAKGGCERPARDGESEKVSERQEAKN